MEKTTIQYDSRNILIVVLVGILVILFIIIVSLMFNLGIVQILTMNWVLTTVYSLFAYLIVDNTAIRKIEYEKIIERPFEVIREVPIQIPIENKTIEVVEKIVTKEVPVYIQESRIRKNFNIPRDNYIASSETKRYHKKNCRFGRLIKNKHKIHNNNSTFFKKKHFKACKICIKKNKQ